MGVPLAKLLLAPTFVIGASLAARRYGVKIGGLVGGLPVVAGPILLVFALDHGDAFAARAAAGTLFGILSLLVFIVVYTRLASGAGSAHWLLSLTSGWGGFFAMTAILSTVSVGKPVALAAVVAGIAVTLLVLPRTLDAQVDDASPPVWDLPLRAASALALVLALTALSGQLGSKLSGLLAPFPVVASVLAVFTHTQRGAPDLVRIMRGFTAGLVAYALFCFVLSVSLEPLGTATAFLLATATALLTQAVALAAAALQGKALPGEAG